MEVVSFVYCRAGGDPPEHAGIVNTLEALGTSPLEYENVMVIETPAVEEAANGSAAVYPKGLPAIAVGTNVAA